MTDQPARCTVMESLWLSESLQLAAGSMGSLQLFAGLMESFRLLAGSMESLQLSWTTAVDDDGDDNGR